MASENSGNASLVFLTAGEWPTRRNVLFSQAYEIVRMEAATGTQVVWLAVIPLRAFFLKSAREELKEVRRACEQAGVSFDVMYFGSSLFSLRMLRQHDSYTTVCASYLSRRIRALIPNRKVVINARSYFATAIGLKVRKALASDYRVRVCFDMRGYLSLTFPASHMRSSLECYARLKEWEAQLLDQSDVALNNRVKGISIAKLEYGIDVGYLPVSGFSEKETASPSEIPSNGRTAAFVGNFSEKFHSFDVLRLIGNQLRNAGIGLEVICENTSKVPPDFKTRSVAFSEMPATYKSLTALIIPGRDNPSSFFMRMALGAYSAPTKMSEALSLGVPIVVGSSLTDIAEFTLENRCGLVFDIKTHEFIDRDGVVDISEPGLWDELREHAVKVAPIFTREHVHELYRQAWFAAD